MKLIFNKQGDKAVVITEGLADFLMDKLKDLLGPESLEKLKSQLGLEDKDLEVEVPQDLKTKYNFHSIPDGKNNFRSAQIEGSVLPAVIKKFGIKNIIRLNGDGVDAKHRSSHEPLSVSDEKKICESLGCKFHKISSHEGYKEGEGYVGSLRKIIPILSEGNTLIHCAHGADRTGGLVGGYLKKTGKMTDLDDLWNYTTKYNGWKRMIDSGRFFGSGYDKYADTFYPMDKMIEKFSK
jgi:hypothetical protein